MAVAAKVTIRLDGTPLDRAEMGIFKSLEVEAGFGKQAIVRLKFMMGQESSGDWASWAEETFTPATALGVEAEVGERTERLINAVITEFKMDFKADPCESQLEVVGMDALEKVKRHTQRHPYSGQSLQTIVSTIYDRQDITPDLTGSPETGSANPNRETPTQGQNDLEYLRRLAEQNGCEAYVEPDGEGTVGFFKPLDHPEAEEINTPVVANRSGQTNVWNASFYYDLTGPTAVAASSVDAQGRAIDPEVQVDLRDHIDNTRDKALLGPPGFANVLRLDRHGRETEAQLRQLCEAELERHSWRVIGKGDMDTSAYGDILIPRRRVRVEGVSSSFSGTFIVWSVTHSFERNLYCQKFEVRKKLGVF